MPYAGGAHGPIEPRGSYEAARREDNSRKVVAAGKTTETDGEIGGYPRQILRVGEQT